MVKAHFFYQYFRILLLVHELLDQFWKWRVLTVDQFHKITVPTFYSVVGAEKVILYSLIATLVSEFRFYWVSPSVREWNNFKKAVFFAWIEKKSIF